MEIEIIVMEITNLVVTEITAMVTINLAVTEMSNLVIVKEVIVRVATDLMTRKDSTTENQVTLFHLAIASSCIKNFRYKNYYIQYPIQEPNSLNLRHYLPLCLIIVYNARDFKFVQSICVLPLTIVCQLY